MRIAPLTDDELEVVDAHCPLSRLDQPGDSVYLVAWDEGTPIGHAHVEWADPPELQDVWVAPERRREGIATALTRAAEALAADGGHGRMALNVSAKNEGAKRLYEDLGYRDTGRTPVRVKGTIMLRGNPFEVDDTLLFLEKSL